MKNYSDIQIIKNIKNMVNRKCEYCGKTFRASKEDSICLECYLQEEDGIYIERDKC